MSKVKTDKCVCLRMVPSTDGININAACNATMDAQCPKLRSTKRTVGPQCWKIVVDTGIPDPTVHATPPAKTAPKKA